MGNRQGHNKEASKPKEEKQHEKDAQKGKKNKDKTEKRKKQLGNKALDPDTDFDESSHVTGGDSESCVFHSAENVSFSPYLDSSTRSEHEQGPFWAGVLDQAAVGSNHPYVLSSKDFQDGFSLEACIPSEIARLEDPNDVSSTTKSRYGHRNPSPNSSTASKSTTEPKAGFSGSHSPATGENCSKISATSSPLSGATEGHKVPLSPKSTPTQKCIKTESHGKQPPLTASGQHHPHFYNHNRTYQHPSPLPATKPTSPQPQRRTLTPRIPSPFKTTTPESPSPAPLTPGPQRRAANFLALFRSSSKRGKAAASKDEDSKTDSTSDETRSRSYSTSNDSERKVKSKPTWKTWERPRSKKSQKPVKDTIFGTSRKSDKKAAKDNSQDVGKKDNTQDVNKKDNTHDVNKKDNTQDVNKKDNTHDVSKEESSGAAVATTGHLLALGDDTSTKERENQHNLTYAAPTTNNHSLISAGSSSLEAKSNNENVSSAESGQVNLARSPPLSSTAAVCILKLEELERSIEKTIREKFPDVEPFLMKKKPKEELHGSRSLPATPSNKKKLHLVGDEGTHIASPQLKNTDVTRCYNETYESPPSPSSSPIVLRRFCARTRHASISPKMQRAKTAALFNSPSEMSSFGASRPAQNTSQVPLYHRLSSDQAGHSEMATTFSAAQKSESKYDNVMGDGDASIPLCKQDNYYPDRHHQLKDNNREETGEASINDSSQDGRDQSQMIIPTFSAVFGSVSPKLRRHLQVKFDEIKDNVDEKKTRIDEGVQLPNHGNKNQPSDTAVKGSHKTERKVTKTGLSSSPACSVSSDTAPDFNQLKVKTLQERSSQLAGQSEEKVNEGRKKAQPHKDRYKASETIGTASPADRTRGINNSVPGLRATRSNAEANCNDNTDPGLNSPQRATGKPSNEAAEITLISFEHGKIPACAVSSHTTQPGEIRASKITAKSGQSGSVGTERTHSTNRVLLFESAVSSPDRSHPTSPPSQASPTQESTCSEKNSHIAQAQDIAPSHGYRYASKQNIVDNLQGESPHQQPTSVSSLSSARDGSLSDAVTSRETGRDLSQQEVAADVSLHHRGFDFNGRTDDGQTLVISTSESDCVIFDRRDEANHSEACVSSLASPKTVNVFCGSGTKANRLEEQYVNLRQKPDRAQLYKFGQDEERVSVLKQPVSEVISQMISRSKLQPRQQERHLQQRQQQQQQQERLRPHITSHEHAVIQPQLVTVQKYEQLSEVLERRCVQAPAGPTAVDFTDELCQSRCQEIQTDSYTTADKSVDSHGLAGTTGNFGFSNTVRTGNSVASIENSGQEVTEDEPTSGCSENELVKMSDQSKKFDREGEDPSSMSEHVPPPSPTALQQLQEECEEEDDDLEDEGDAIQAMATLNTEQLKMKEFSDTIYKRLSELLGNNPEDESDVHSSHRRDKNEPEDLASEKEGSSTCDTNPEIIACTNKDMTTTTEAGPSIQTGFPVSPLVKILTVDTSSSLTTTTSSESDLDDTPLMFHSFQNDENNDGGMFENTDNYAERQEEGSDLMFGEFDETKLEKPTDPDLKPTSRDYHSDDDVAKGRGIPDYYDDRPLWSRRQKPPGQLSATMMAIRWRERRERWLKKRRRNRTDLMSTGSSDTGSEYCLNRHDEPTDDNYFQYDRDHEKTKRTNDMGSGILTSPKYSKPIIPFFDTQAGSAESHTASHVHSSVHRRKRHDNRSISNRGGCSSKQGSHITHGDDIDRKYADANIKNKDKENGNEMNAHSSTAVRSGVGAPSIEDTFQELMSVQTILKEMQECRCSVEDITEKPGLLPLTTENVRSIRDYYKDFYTSGNGRRSRMSATDRTESDLDLYSEIPDDASSESELYADDEGDDEGQEPYATAEDEAGATGRGSSTSCRSSKRDEGRHDEEDDSDTSLVLSCTFYNSNTHQKQATDTTEVGPTAIYSMETKPTHRSTPAPPAPTPHANLNSDEEFWTGSAVIEESYKQLETAADAVSSTFQNARDQMHDIQYHLQALRRQMEVMQSDLTNVTLSLSESASTEHVKK